MEFLEIPFEIKEESLDKSGFFEGYGSTFGGKPDSYGDIIVEGAFSESLKSGGRNGTGVAMLWQHNSDQPIGVWNSLVENKRGLKVQGQIAMDTQLGHDAYILMKMGALKGLSIGYDIIDFEYDNSKEIRKLKTLDLWEISPVTFPANTRATITSVKKIKEATNVRDFERVLRESGLSNEASRYVVSLCRDSLSESVKESEPEIFLDQLKEIRQILKETNNDLLIKQAFLNLTN